MEPALCEVCKDARIGKILIQTNMETHEPEVYYNTLYSYLYSSPIYNNLFYVLSPN